jgi:signal transduction histidine kinase
LIVLGTRSIFGRFIVRPTETAQPMTIEVDPLKLDSVILNLVVNARDAMPEGGSIEIVTAAIERGSAGIQA